VPLVILDDIRILVTPVEKDDERLDVLPNRRQSQVPGPASTTASTFIPYSTLREQPSSPKRTSSTQRPRKFASSSRHRSWDTAHFGQYRGVAQCLRLDPVMCQHVLSCRSTHFGAQRPIAGQSLQGDAQSCDITRRG
jgi:hypothetical protein